jgi:hypothetical protein
MAVLGKLHRSIEAQGQGPVWAGSVSASANNKQNDDVCLGLRTAFAPIEAKGDFFLSSETGRSSLLEEPDQICQMSGESQSRPKMPMQTIKVRRPTLSRGTTLAWPTANHALGRIRAPLLSAKAARRARASGWVLTTPATTASA